MEDSSSDSEMLRKVIQGDSPLGGIMEDHHGYHRLETHYGKLDTTKLCMDFGQGVVRVPPPSMPS